MNPGSELRGAPDAGTPGSTRTVLLIVFATILIDFVGFSVLVPVLPLYAERLGAVPHQVGLILAIYALAQLLFLPAWGWVSDRVGRRPVLLVSLLGTALSFGLLAVSDTIGMIYVARALGGFFAASIGTAQAVVTDVTSSRDRAGGMGAIGAAFGAGMIFGPVLGGTLAIVDEKAPFYAISVLAVANLVLAWARLPETRPPDLQPPRWRDLGISLVPTPVRLLGAVHDRRTALYLYLFFHLFGAFAVVEALVTLYMAISFGVSELEVALVFAWIGVVIVLTQGYLVRRLVISIGEARLVVVGIGAMGVGLVGVSLAPSFGWFYAVGAVIALGNGLAFPSFTSLYSRACQADQAGELLAESQSMATAGRIVGPYAAGLLMEWWSPGAPFWMAGLMMFVALGVFWASRATLVDGLP